MLGRNAPQKEWSYEVHLLRRDGFPLQILACQHLCQSILLRWQMLSLDGGAMTDWVLEILTVILCAVLVYILRYARATPGFYGRRKPRRVDGRMAFFIRLLGLGTRTADGIGAGADRRKG